MKTRQWQWWLAASVGVVMAVVMTARGDNPCIETTTTNGISCTSGTLVSNYLLLPTNITAVVGEPYALPTVSGLLITNGSETYSVTYSCYPLMDTNLTQPINYLFGNVYLVSTPPNIFWTPGVYNYTALVNASGSLCGIVTNTLGNVTITVSSNTPDVLLDVDFGGATNSSMIGYTMIGDSLNDYWNYYIAGGHQPVGVLTNLYTADGYISPVSMIVTNLLAPGTNGSPNAMYNDYLSTNGVSAKITFTNLPAGVWNVYLYSADGNFSLAVTNPNSIPLTNYGPATCRDLHTSAGPLWQQGVQYVAFTNVVVNNGQILVVMVAPGQSGVASISGLQIASSYHNPVLPVAVPGMVAWWKAESNYLDSVGSNNGTPENGMNFMPGESGTAFNFNGTNSFVLVTNASVDVGEWIGMTMEGWIKPANLNSAMILCEYERALGTSSGADVGLQLVLNNIPTVGEYPGAVGVNLVDTTGNSHALGTAAYAITPGVWNHIALTYNQVSGVAALYVNGTLAQQANIGMFEPQTDFTNVLLGGRTTFHSVTSPSNLFAGGMDEFSIYNQDLSASEISSIYQSGFKGKIPSATQDSDYDGVSDANEFIDRTDPYDLNSVQQIRLAYFPFDDTNAWVGSAGQLPLLADDVIGVPGWSTNAVLVDDQNPLVGLSVTNAMVITGADEDSGVYYQMGGTETDDYSGNVYSNLWNNPANGSDASPWAYIAMRDGYWTIYNSVSGIYTEMYINTNTSGIYATIPPPTGWQTNANDPFGNTVPPTSVTPQTTIASGILVSNYDVFVITGAGTAMANGTYYPYDGWSWTNINGGTYIMEDGFAGGIGYDIDDSDGNMLYSGICHFDVYGDLSSPFNEYWETFAGNDPPPYATPLVTTNPAANLVYRDVETNGNANINLRCGSVRFWFSPDWSSVNAGGSGPGSIGRLIEMGNYNPYVSNSVTYYTNGWWALYLSSDGNTLNFGSSTNGFGGTNLTANISWAWNQWHQVVLTYTPTNSWLYLDGQPVTNGTAYSYYPNLAERSAGFRIGSDQNGYNQARGIFDELETFNYPLSATNVLSSYLNTVGNDGNGILNVFIDSPAKGAVLQ